MAFGSVSFGRSRKKTWSNRPFRMNSAGRRWIRFAVAATKTSASFSCIQVRNVEKIRPRAGPPPPASLPPAPPLPLPSARLPSSRDRHLDFVDPEQGRGESLHGDEGPMESGLGVFGPEDEVHVQP